MNRKQKICLWIGIAIIVVMGLFPPWIYGKEWSGGLDTFVLHQFILNPPHPERVYILSGVRLYVSQLCIQWAIVAIITGGLVVTFADKKDKQKQD